MKLVIQRVKESSVEIDNKIKAEIGKGLLVLIGISQEDNKLDVEWLANSTDSLFQNDRARQMSLSDFL